MDVAIGTVCRQLGRWMGQDGEWIIDGYFSFLHDGVSFFLGSIRLGVDIVQ